MKRLLLILMVLLTQASFSQTLTDGLMMPKDNLCTGFVYAHDQWKEYWEGELKRDNGNIGKLTTQSLLWMGNYGITNKLNIIAMLPYVKTQASAGTLQGMQGIQDISVGVKYNFLGAKFEKSAFNTFGVFNFSTPLNNYTPDFYPLSLGAHTTNLSYRLTAHYKLEQGWFANVSAGYTWRSNTELDRPSYYDGNDFYNSREVKMPDVFDVFGSIGYQKDGLQAELNYMQQNTLGGADIRRQDMPFVSNRMNYIKAGALIMYYPAKIKSLALRGAVAYTVTGRNVGQSTTYLAGVLYTFQFSKNQ
ncbi:MAG: transporter [Cyclobacteriaceae bacterium]|nr:transporter [Cyclobacteriaceae bacterium]